MNLLFVSAGNGALGAIAAAYANAKGGGRLRAYCSGCEENKDREAIRAVLTNAGYAQAAKEVCCVDDVKGAPIMDMVVRVCGANEQVCSPWSGSHRDSQCWQLRSLETSADSVLADITGLFESIRMQIDGLVASFSGSQFAQANELSAKQQVEPDFRQKLMAEAIGTILLLATVVGSGIMADSLSGGNTAIALLGNTIPTGAILVVLILIFGPISGAHFNPAVTLHFALAGALRPLQAVAYVAVQIIAAIVGVMLAHLMFGEPAISVFQEPRTGTGQWAGEFVATFALLAAILGCVKYRPEAVPYAVGLVITAGYWYTSSTSFANPAVTIGRTFTDSFAGIRAADAPMFIVMQIAGALAATWLFAWLHRSNRS